MTDEDGLPDLGLTHIGLMVKDVDASIDFYSRYAGMEVIHRRDDTSGPVVWISDLHHPFAVVLIQVEEVTASLGGYNHIGVGAASRDEVDRAGTMATEEGRLIYGPMDDGDPVGYWVFIRDPDGHMLQISYGQEVGKAVAVKRQRNVAGK